MKTVPKRTSFFLLTLSAVILALSREGAILSVLSFISLVPLILIASKEKSRLIVFLYGITFGFAYNLFMVYWVTNTMVNYGGLSIIEAVFILILLCIYLSIYWGIFSMIVNFIHRRRLCIFIIAPVWVLLEYGISYFLTGFPWTLIGYNLARNLVFIQVLDLGGVYLLSFVIILVNILIFNIVLDRSVNAYANLIAIALIISLIVIYGLFRLKQYSNEEIKKQVKIALIQPNIDQGEKMDRKLRADILDRMLNYLSTFDSHENEIDLVIFPETAFNINIKNTHYLEQLKRWSRATGKSVLTGTMDYTPKGREGEIYYHNASLYVDRGGHLFYHKIHLVPFGEYLPLPNMPIIKNLRNIVGIDTERGDKRVVFEDPAGFSVITPICFEIIFPEEIANWACRDVDSIITLTNDAWFGRTKASVQHFDKVVYRAVENRRTSLMAANTGVSGFVDASGRKYDMTDIFVEEIIVTEINLYENRRTIWNHIYKYNIFIYISLIVILIIQIIFKVEKR